MEDTKILFETAKLAKEKGFNLLCSAYYAFDDSEEEWILLGENSPSFINNRETHFAAPTQSLLQKWLREKHNIHIWVYYSMILESHFYQIRYEVSKNEYQHFTNELDINKLTNTNKFTHEESLELALVQALTLINN